MKQYIKSQIRVLKDFMVWDKMSELEKQEFKSRTTEISVDNTMKEFIKKYL